MNDIGYSKRALYSSILLMKYVYKYIYIYTNNLQQCLRGIKKNRVLINIKVEASHKLN